LKKIRLSFTFDVLPEIEDAAISGTKKWIEITWKANRIAVNRREIYFKKEVK